VRLEGLGKFEKSNALKYDNSFMLEALVMAALLIKPSPAIHHHYLLHR
jgi:hypothetical protein